MDSREVYQYTKLDEANAFRLIVLKPAAALVDPIHGDLIVCKLSDYDNDIFDHYVALSYVWGDQYDRRTILVDSGPESKRLNIAATLDSALRHIRDTATVGL